MLVFLSRFSLCARASKSEFYSRLCSWCFFLWLPASCVLFVHRIEVAGARMLVMMVIVEHDRMLYVVTFN